jgi:hypothetical protein
LEFRFINLLSIIVATTAVYTGLLVLVRTGSIRNHHNHTTGESVSFLVFMLGLAIWVLNPYTNAINPIIPWFTACIAVLTGLVFLLFITDLRNGWWVIPLGALPLVVLALMYFSGLEAWEYFHLTFLIVALPAITIFLFLLVSFYKKSKSLLHISFALSSVPLVLSGVADTLLFQFGYPILWLNVYSTLLFIVVAGFNVIVRGYLSGQSWKDYMVELKKNDLLLKEQNILLRKASSQSVIVLSQTIEAKDPYTRGHCLRVRDYSRRMGEILGFTAQQLLNLEYGAILHDIGKLVVPGAILNKPAQLEPEEMDQIKIHPAVGEKIIANIQPFQPLLPMVRHHHERFDGEGYPDGLKGMSIPLEARILAVVDTWDAMTSDRPYRGAMLPEQALAIMHEVAGRQLDPELVMLFIEMKIYLTAHNITERLVL